MKYLGNLFIRKGDNTDYSGLTEVSGNIYVREGATFTAPTLIYCKINGRPME